MAVRIPSATLRYLFKASAPLRIFQTPSEFRRLFSRDTFLSRLLHQILRSGQGVNRPLVLLLVRGREIEVLEALLGLLHGLGVLLQARLVVRSANLTVPELLQHVRSPRYVGTRLGQVLLG